MDVSKNNNQNNRREHFHSNAYARAAGNSMGATDPTSFSARKSLERNRQNVRRYGDSMIGMGHMRETYRSELVSPSENNDYVSRRAQARSVRPIISKPITGSKPTTAPSKPTFREPPTRYNPYG